MKLLPCARICFSTLCQSIVVGRNWTRLEQGIWNPQRLAADLAGKNGKTLRANMESVLGKKQASEIIAANQVLDAGSALKKINCPRH